MIMQYEWSIFSSCKLDLKSTVSVCKSDQIWKYKNYFNNYTCRFTIIAIIIIK